MAFRDPPFLETSQVSYGGEELRLLIQAITSPSFAGGIVGANDLLVSAQATPDATIKVAAGHLFVKGTENANQGTYHAYNDAVITLAVAPTGGGVSRIDRVIARVNDDYYSGAAHSAEVLVVPGVAAGSPTAPSLAAYKNYVELATLLVPPSTTNITTGMIFDVRPKTPRVQRFGAAGAALAAFSAETTIATLAIPAQPVDCIALVNATVRLDQTVTTDTFAVRLYDAAAILDGGQSAQSGSAINMHTLPGAYLFMAANVAKTVTMKGLRSTGTGTGQTYADLTSNIVQAVVIPIL